MMNTSTQKVIHTLNYANCVLAVRMNRKRCVCTHHAHACMHAWQPARSLAASSQEHHSCIVTELTFAYPHSCIYALDHVMVAMHGKALALMSAATCVAIGWWWCWRSERLCTHWSPWTCFTTSKTVPNPKVLLKPVRFNGNHMHQEHCCKEGLSLLSSWPLI